MKMSEERNMQQTKKYLATLVVTLLALSIFIAAIPNANADTVYATSAIPTNPTQGATTSDNITFTTATSTVSGGELNYIEYDFPSSMVSNVAAATVDSTSGVGAGVLSITGFALRYTLASAVAVPAGTVISIKLNNIVNPSTSGNYVINIFTRSIAFGTPLIDSGSAQFVISGVIPEFPSATMLVLLTMMASALALALGKKHRPTLKSHLVH